MKVGDMRLTMRQHRVREQHEPGTPAVCHQARKRLWKCGALETVEAYTKSEARRLFVEQLRAAEALSFHPRRIERLPVGAVVEEIA